MNKIKTALIFSGQGAQYAGMGRNLYATDPEARAIFDLAGPDIKAWCFDSPGELLNRTDITQPCVYTMNMAGGAAALALLGRYGIKPQAAAGFSLGEFSALSCADVFGFGAGLELINKRAALMEQAGNGRGAMVAMLGSRKDLARAIEDCAGDGFLIPVNFNCPGQTVVSGTFDALDRLKHGAKDYSLKYIPLRVSGPFHTPLFDSVADKLYNILGGIALGEPSLDVYANLDGAVYTQADIPRKLSRQVSSPVRWEDTLLNMRRDGVELFVEAGPGRVLGGFVKKTLPDATAVSIDDGQGLAELEAILEGKPC